MKSFILPALALTLALPARAEEGMWTFDNLPTKVLKQRYGFEPTQAWLDHLRLSCLHWGGASGSFVSPDGLVLTNHHVGRSSVAKISPKDQNWLRDGYIARTRAEEVKVPGLTLRTLMHMENVTAKVNAVVKKGMKDADAVKAREKAHAALRDEVAKATGLQCDAITFYEGGEYWVYGYKLHKDVRLVAAPELQVGLFGGDPDNFTYPRHDLDFCLFRIYENDQPYKPAHFLKVNPEGVKLGDLTFVSGHPGRTSRAFTHAQMTFEREVAAPLSLKLMERQRAVLQAHIARSEANAKSTTTRLLGLENGLKASQGFFIGLKDQAAMATVKAKEDALRAAVAKNPALKASAGQSWTRIEEALNARRTWYKESVFVNAPGSQLVEAALSILQYHQEMARPADKRSPQFADETRLKAFRERLLTVQPADEEALRLEAALFAATLQTAQEELPAGHPFLQATLAGRTPEAAAQAVVSGSRLTAAAERKALLEGGLKAVEASTDPAVVLARALFPMQGALKARQEAYKTALAEQGSRIAKARFQVYGRTTYPDANGTLRLGFGPVATYPANGTLVQPFTTYGGLYDRHDGWGGNAAAAQNGAWVLPQRWLDARAKLDLSTPLNFAHAVDTIGGNSGSPIVNAKGELVGLLFDGNYEGLPSRYFYDEKVNRSLSVDPRGILEALRKVYDAPHLVKELLGQ